MRATSGVSVVRMYAGALLPGLLLAGLYLVYVVDARLLQPEARAEADRRGGRRAFHLSQIFWMLLTSFFPLAFLILAVLGAILFGFATPSEAAAIGALGGLLLAARLSRADLAAAAGIRLSDRPHLGDGVLAVRRLGDLRLGLRLSRRPGADRRVRHRPRHVAAEFLIVAQVIIFILGWPLEWTEIIIIFIPIFLPLLAHFEIDPLFFGILVAVNLQTAFLSPPMAMSAYYLKGIAPPHVQLSQIFRGMMPYMLIVILCHGDRLRLPADRLLAARTWSTAAERWRRAAPASPTSPRCRRATRSRAAP